MEPSPQPRVLPRIIFANLLAAFVLFWISSPITYIPSDDIFFNMQIGRYVQSLEMQERANWFLPEPALEFTKPLLIFLSGALLWGTHHLTPMDINSMQALLVFNYVPFALNAAILQMAAYQVAPKEKWQTVGLSALLYYTSISVFSSLLWTGYAHFMALQVLLFLCLLHQCDEKHHVYKWRYVFVLALSISALVLTHLASIPFIAGGFVALLMRNNAPRKDLKNILKGRGVLAFKVLVVSALLFGAVNWMSGWEGKMSYLEMYYQSFQMNVKGHFGGEAPRISWLFHATGILYYLSLEGFLTLIAILAMGCLLVLRVPLSAVKYFNDTQGRIFLASLFFALLFVSVTSNTKLLRNFFPVHLGVLHGLLLILLYIKEKGSEKKLPAQTFPSLILATVIMCALSLKENVCSFETFHQLPHKLYQEIQESDRKATTIYMIEDELKPDLHPMYFLRFGLPSNSIWFDPGPIELKAVSAADLSSLGQKAKQAPGFLLTGQMYDVPGFKLQQVFDYPPCHFNRHEMFQEEVATQQYLENFVNDPLEYFSNRLLGNTPPQYRFYLYASAPAS